jgi:hypothetical protein
MQDNTYIPQRLQQPTSHRSLWQIGQMCHNLSKAETHKIPPADDWVSDSRGWVLWDGSDDPLSG